MAIDKIKYRSGLTLHGLISGVKTTSPVASSSQYKGWLMTATRLIDGGEGFLYHSFASVAARDSFFSGSLGALFRLRTFAIVDSPAALYVWNGVDSPASYSSGSWVNIMPSGSGYAFQSDIMGLLSSIALGITSRSNLPSLKQLVAERKNDTDVTIDISNFYTPPTVHDIAIEGLPGCHITELPARDSFVLCFALYGGNVMNSAALSVTVWDNGVATKHHSSTIALPTGADLYSLASRTLEVALTTASGIANVAGNNGVHVVFDVVDTHGDTYSYRKEYTMLPDKVEDDIILFYTDDKTYVADNISATMRYSRSRLRPFEVAEEFEGYKYLNVIHLATYTDINDVRIEPYDVTLRGSFAESASTVSLSGTAYTAFQSCGKISSLSGKKILIS